MKLTKRQYLRAFDAFYFMDIRIYFSLIWLYSVIFLVLTFFTTKAPIISLPFALLWIILVFLYKRRQYALSMSDKSYLFDETEWVWAENQMNRITSKYCDSIRLTDIISYKETKSYLYVMTSREGYYLISKKAISNSDLQQFKEYLKRRPLAKQ